MKFSEIKTAVDELGDGRTFANAKQLIWLKRVRKTVALNAIVGGFRGIYFLYKEATVEGGSVANQSKYAIPDDFIDDLNVFYAGKLLLKAPPGLLDITLEQTATATSPTWVRMMGLEFDILPKPVNVGDEIKLLYNGFPDEITQADDEDYFMKHWPDLHIFGMGVYACLSIGDKEMVNLCKELLTEQEKLLLLHNRRHFLKNTHIRFLNWDEYQSAKQILFPQFSLV